MNTTLSNNPTNLELQDTTDISTPSTISSKNSSSSNHSSKIINFEPTKPLEPKFLSLTSSIDKEFDQHEIELNNLLRDIKSITHFSDIETDSSSSSIEVIETRELDNNTSYTHLNIASIVQDIK